MSANPDVSRGTPKRILMVVANPSVATSTGWPVVLWASEPSHPYYEFTEAGEAVTIAGPQSGTVVIDGLSGPRDANGYTARDLIGRGLLDTPKLTAILGRTAPLADVRGADFDAVVVAGGRSPTFTFPAEKRLHHLLAEFYRAEEVTAARCRGVFRSFAVRDGWLVTGQQQNSGSATAGRVIEALGV